MAMEDKDQVTPGTDHPYPDRKHKHSLRNMFLMIATLAVIAFIAYRLTDRNAGGTHTRPAAAVGTASAIHTDMPVVVTALGTVQPLVTATVRPQLSGVLFNNIPTT